ncbi:hypothetical protein B296_00015558 [Ensete ventricosum]|uniref:Uncharacterized protein n=1 Tax=Ensete ventricosum TaxID=4639 RepID=A0A427AL01_ENSVE|nr:hypothetical protein B296_00015558 [Ensete ventricosum]
MLLTWALLPRLHVLRKVKEMPLPSGLTSSLVLTIAIDARDNSFLTKRMVAIGGPTAIDARALIVSP